MEACTAGSHELRTNADTVDEALKVLLVDDHPVVLEALESRLAKASHIRVIGRAQSGEEALQKVALQQPDLVLMDLRMPGMGGLETIRRLKASWPSVSVIVLTVSESHENLLDAVLAGAAGYMTKDSSPALLLDAIRAVGEGASILPADLLLQSVRELSLNRHPTAATTMAHLKEPLTEREFEVLELLAKGNPNKSISAALNIVEATVKKHVHNIIRKLEVSDRTQAVIAAIRLALVTP